jgi:hypothetical protein
MMPHPFISDISNKTMDELQNTIQDLTKKLNFVYRQQNGQMISQMRMALESYRVEYSKRIDEAYKKQNLQSKINVSKDSK